MLVDVNAVIEDDNAPGTYVSASSVAGRGLFAAEFFSPGEVIIDYNLFPSSWYELRYVDLSEEQIRMNWYVMLDEERCITSDRYSKFSYINHSRTPNCLWLVEERKIVAAAPIASGNELFIDYRLEPRPTRAEYPAWI